MWHADQVTEGVWAWRLARRGSLVKLRYHARRRLTPQAPWQERLLGLAAPLVAARPAHRQRLVTEAMAGNLGVAMQ